MKKIYITLILLAAATACIIGCNPNDNTSSSNNNIAIVGDPSTTDDPTATEDEISPELTAAYRENIEQSFVDVKFKTNALSENPTGYITSQCYTKPVDEHGNIHNPCFSCHINDGSEPFQPNFFADNELQVAYDFPTEAYENRFSNLFKDRSTLIQAISDANITAYVNQDNYLDENGRIMLAETLQNNLPEEWDVDGDGKWSGYVPNCYFSFDEEGFDRTPDGNYTGWRAFRYSPFLGTFWPTNGSTDDVLIRLSDDFQQNDSGQFDLTVYKINLAVVESLIKFTDIAIDPIDENNYGIDLNNNGVLDTASHIAFKESFGVGMRFVGKMKNYLEDNIYKNVARGLYPVGTEFLHSVRYIKSDANGTIGLAPRMKELRWAKKTTYNSYGQLENVALEEIKSRHDFPDRIKSIGGNAENGIGNGLGWVYQGFIEDKEGALRPQNYEETVYCIGCHGNLGATTDSSFSFPRKLDGEDSWLHWSQKGLKGIKDRNITGSNLTEYLFYLKTNGAGDEFRGNEEVKAKFFNDDGSLNENAEAIKEDITELIFPSHERALELNKAYKIIVDEQSYIRGRDAHVKPLDDTVYKQIEKEETGIETAVSHRIIH